jgi:hypothetical protein
MAPGAMLLADFVPVSGLMTAPHRTEAVARHHLAAGKPGLGNNVTLDSVGRSAGVLLFLLDIGIWASRVWYGIGR